MTTTSSRDRRPMHFPPPGIVVDSASTIVAPTPTDLARFAADVAPKAWYLAGDCVALRASLADGAKLPERYETWALSTEQVEREVQRSGIEVVRVMIEPAAFLAWCTRAGLPSDNAARSRYAAGIISE